MSKVVLAFWVFFAFQTGWITRYAMQDMYDREAKQLLIAQRYSCSGYLIVTETGDHRCAALMNRFDPDWAIKPSPLKLRRAEIKKAIGG